MKDVDESVWETKGDGTVVRKQPPGTNAGVYILASQKNCQRQLLHLVSRSQIGQVPENLIPRLRDFLKVCFIMIIILGWWELI